MGDNYSEFMPPIMEYAVDSAPTQPLIIAGKEVAQITPELFVDKLYVRWPNEEFEENLYQRLLNSTHLTCVAAFRGSGKTSALCHAVSRLAREHKNDVVAVMLDIKKLFDNGMFAPLTEKATDESLGRAYHIFRTEIRKLVQTRLMPGPANTLKLLAWALAGPPDQGDSFDDLLVAGLIDLSDRAILAAHAVNKTRRERKTSIEHLLATDQKALDFHQSAMDHITTAHVVRAAMATRSWKRVVLIFDNIDRLPMAYQLKFMEAVNDTHNALSGVCGTVVAVRRETLRRQISRANSKGDPIDIIAPAAAEYPPILFPDTKPDHVKRILQCRHDYSIGIYEANATDAASELAKVIALHERVVDEFVRDSIHALANGSIRALAKIYTGFFWYVHRAESSNVTREIDVRTDEGHLQTLFFLFLRDNAREYGLVYYEIIKPESDVTVATDVPDIASPHHLLLTALLNLTNELQATAGGEHHATFAQLVRRVGQLGFSFETVKTALADMHAVPGESPRTIEFIDVEPTIDALEPDSNFRMRLTPLGQVLVTSLLHKVGYIWGQAHDAYIRSTGRREKAKPYYDLEAFERVRIFFSYARGLAINHLKLLSLVRDRLQERHGRGWLPAYRRFFGVGGQFQVQRLCASAAAFYQPLFNRAQANPFITLRHAYNELLNEIVHGAAYGDLDVRRLQSRALTHNRPREVSDSRSS
jgi:hypothetical protein